MVPPVRLFPSGTHHTTGSSFSFILSDDQKSSIALPFAIRLRFPESTPSLSISYAADVWAPENPARYETGEYGLPVLTLASKYSPADFIPSGEEYSV